MQSALLLQAFT